MPRTFICVYPGASPVKITNNNIVISDDFCSHLHEKEQSWQMREIFWNNPKISYLQKVFMFLNLLRNPTDVVKVSIRGHPQSDSLQTAILRMQASINAENYDDEPNSKQKVEIYSPIVVGTRTILLCYESKVPEYEFAGGIVVMFDSDRVSTHCIESLGQTFDINIHASEWRKLAKFLGYDDIIDQL